MKEIKVLDDSKKEALVNKILAIFEMKNEKKKSFAEKVAGTISMVENAIKFYVIKKDPKTTNDEPEKCKIFNSNSKMNYAKVKQMDKFHQCKKF